MTEEQMVQRDWADVVLAGEADPAVLTRAVRRGTLVRLARGVYSGRTAQDPEDVARACWLRVVAAVLPGATVVGPAAELLARRAAAGLPVEPLPAEIAVLDVLHDRRTTLRLPGVVVRSAPGPRPGRTLALPRGIAVERVAGAAEPATGTGQRSGAPRTAPVQAAGPLPRLSAAAQAVGLELVRGGPATRPELSARLGLSKPTVSVAVAELERAGLALQRTSRSGATGRSAAVYAVAPNAGWTLGIDLGNAQVRLAARGIAGDRLGERRATLRQAGSVDRLLEVTAHALAELRAGLVAAGPLLAVAVALPKPVRADHRLTGREGPSLGGLAPEELLARLGVPAGVPVLAENNVNCAVLAETGHGVAAGRQDVVFVQVGERIGAGVVVGGVLVHGARGGAGEVADLPFPWADDRAPQELGAERHVGAAALVARLPGRPAAGDLRAQVDALLARAEAGDAVAVAAVRDHAREVARVVTALVAVLDPEVVVLGGPVGEHPLVVRWVRAELAGLSGHTEVVPSALGGAATVEGAAALAARHLVGELFPASRRASGNREPGLTDGSVPLR
ncbi:ROK family transcriptional regulator [Cellulomonas sp.]|uniref:ROK family transcriptional regulator n=1 Tax=Cellulomonas sp. TaxID=40001 RepID=UPI002D455EF0|nr:ROK family transcriptional regulator [Cellulomonas sp.]HYQ76838.1 ROK family transcriptional regulator [Cellulomonas sp.]